MKLSDFKEGEIGFCLTSPGYIFRKTVTGFSCSFLKPITKEFKKNNGDFTGSHSFREATEEEKGHFMECEKAGKYVEYITPEYLLFN